MIILEMINLLMKVLIHSLDYMHIKFILYRLIMYGYIFFINICGDIGFYGGCMGDLWVNLGGMFDGYLGSLFYVAWIWYWIQEVNL
jgi:hypothetical protein